MLSEKISSPMIQDAHRDFSLIQDELSSDTLSRQLFPEKEHTDSPWYAPFMVADHVDAIKDRLTSLTTYFTEKSQQLAIWTIKLIAAYLFECIVFPLTFFIILFVFTKYMIRYLCGLHRSHTIMHEIDRLFKHYAKTAHIF